MIDMAKTFWSFIEDLKLLGSDVKAQVLHGGCRWSEPSLIPEIVERLSKLDFREIENIFPYVICNDVAKTRLRNEVEDIFNFHLYDDLDLDNSDIDRVALYAKWLNRFILICGENGMGDIIPLCKQDAKDSGGNEPQQGGIDAEEIPDNIASIFKPTFRNNGIMDKNSRNVAKEYLDEVRGCSLSVCADVYNNEYAAKGKAIKGSEWGKKKKILYDFLADHIVAAKDIKERTFDNKLK